MELRALTICIMLVYFQQISTIKPHYRPESDSKLILTLIQTKLETSNNRHCKKSTTIDCTVKKETVDVNKKDPPFKE